LFKPDAMRQPSDDSKKAISRRDWIGFVAAGLAASLAPGCVPSRPRAGDRKGASLDPLFYASARTLARAIRARRLSSAEIVEAHLERIAAVNPKLNAVVQLVADQARAAAREADAALARDGVKGALHGVPITLKDSFDTAGIISTGGTKGRAQYVPERDATVVARLRNAGAVLLGKTNTPELTLAGETDNLIYGRTNNPYDLSRSPGGSSGGSAAIVAAGGSPLDLGSDTGGSIRLPAHWTGIAGIRPNSGRVPRTGHIIPYGMGALDALTQIGPMARYVEDLALALPLLAGSDWQDPAIVNMPLGDPRRVELRGLRVAFHTDNGIMTPEAAIADTVRRAAAALEAAGMRVQEARPPGIERSFALLLALFFADGGAGVRRRLASHGTREVHPYLSTFQNMGTPALDGAKFGELLEQVDRFRSEMLAFMEAHDLILCPPGAFTALPHGEVLKPDRFPGFSYAGTYNLTGWPGVVVRGGTSPGGLPIGVQVVARAWREDVALAVASHLESALGGFQPPSL
jgi:amidase